MKQIPSSIWTLLAGIAVACISLWAGQHYSVLFPEQASLQAPLVDKFFGVMATIGVALFLVVEGAILFFAIKYRRPPGDDTDGSPLEGNIPLEIVWTAIPAVLVIGIGIYSVQVYAEMGGFTPGGPSDMTAHNHLHQGGMMSEAIAAPLLGETPTATTALASSETSRYGLGEAAGTAAEKRPDLTVNVTGMQYAWLFNYPDTNLISGELHIPVGQDILLNITAQDVIHSFWVPQFRIKQDAMPGQPSQIRFTATKAGTYPIVCAELCGGYHGSMRTTLVAHTPEDYQAWLAEQTVATQPDLSTAIAHNS